MIDKQARQNNKNPPLLSVLSVANAIIIIIIIKSTRVRDRVSTY
jgi:hypothetical protein